MRFFSGVLLLLAAVSAGAQTDYSHVTFHFEHAGLPVPVYTFDVGDNGLGTYKARSVAVAASGGNPYSMTAPAAGEPVETLQALHLNEAAIAKVFGLVRATHGLTGCAARMKGIADTGTKVLTFHEAYKGDVTCTYNYSESKPVVELTTFLQAMAFTLDEARAMQAEQRFDRLGLDREMKDLVAAVKDGRAAGLSNIRPVLEGIVADLSLLERVRTAAAKLLELSTTAP